MNKELTLKQFLDLISELITLEPFVEVTSSSFVMGDDSGTEKEAYVIGFSRHSKPGYELVFDFKANGDLDGYLIDMFNFTLEPHQGDSFTPVFKGAIVLDDFKEPFTKKELAEKVLEYLDEEKWQKWIWEYLPEPQMII